MFVCKLVPLSCFSPALFSRTILSSGSPTARLSWQLSVVIPVVLNLFITWRRSPLDHLEQAASCMRACAFVCAVSSRGVLRPTARALTTAAHSHSFPWRSHSSLCARHHIRHTLWSPIDALGAVCALASRPLPRSLSLACLHSALNVLLDSHEAAPPETLGDNNTRARVRKQRPVADSLLVLVSQKFK